MFRKLCNLFVTDESGQNLIEYGFIVGLIGLAAITCMTSLGTSVKGVFNAVSSSLTSAV